MNLLHNQCLTNITISNVFYHDSICRVAKKWQNKDCLTYHNRKVFGTRIHGTKLQNEIECLPVIMQISVCNTVRVMSMVKNKNSWPKRYKFWYTHSWCQIWKLDWKYSSYNARIYVKYMQTSMVTNKNYLTWLNYIARSFFFASILQNMMKDHSVTCYRNACNSCRVEE